MIPALNPYGGKVRCMHDPVILSDGHTYERRYIEKWLLHKDPGLIFPNCPLSASTNEHAPPGIREYIHIYIYIHMCSIYIYIYVYTYTYLFISSVYIVLRSPKIARPLHRKGPEKDPSLENYLYYVDIYKSPLPMRLPGEPRIVPDTQMMSGIFQVSSSPVT